MQTPFSADGIDAETRNRRANRRRFIVFLSVFVALAFVGLVWDFSRPAIYQATAQLNFVPAVGQTADEVTTSTATTTTTTTPDLAASNATYSIRDEVQYLTSRKLLAKVWVDLKDLAGTPAALRTADPAATLQAMLAAKQVPGTNIAAIEANGRDPAFLATLVDHVIAAYRASLDERFQGGSTTALSEMRDQEQKLAASLVDKRNEVDTFRSKYNIVSLDRDENQVLSEVKGTATALNLANQKVITAESRLNALKEAQSQGKTVIRSRDSTTLTSLEQQDAAIRADLRATARQFTEQYMEMDPRVKAQRARLAEIDEQIASVRKDSQAGAVQEAQEDLAAARGAAAALRQQLATNQGAVQTFTSHFNEYRALQEQVAHLEQLHQKAVDRVDVLDIGERSRKPKVEVVEPPSIPQSPSSPAYARDAAIALFVALFIGLAAMGVVEIFNQRPQQSSSTVVVPQAWAPVGMTHPEATALPSSAREVLAEGALRPPAWPSPALPSPLPRELTEPELEALLGAADPELRAQVALLLSGLTLEEIVDLRRGNVTRDAGLIAVSGRDPRSVHVPSQVVAMLPASSQPADAPLLTTVGGRPFDGTDIGTSLLYAAHDAGIDGADDITPETLRHTYIAFLVRQGARFSELARLVGALPADRLSAYRRMAPAVAPSGEFERVLPAVRALGATSS